MDKDETILKNGGVGILATDTLYGVVGQALNRATVERIYTIKKRTPSKPFIILISDKKELALFDITTNKNMDEILDHYWPGPVSIILDCLNPDLAYLHRSTNALAFRMPAKKELQEILSTSGPLVAPSANPESLPPAANIEEAKAYFGDTVDFYQEGLTTTKPSRIIKISDGKEEIIRS